MKISIYPRLARTGISKNKRLYVPYILTCVGMVAVFYIIAALSYNSVIKGMKGEGSVKLILNLGEGVIGIFSLIFLFYTNSFLIRRRNREFGLYNILGMGKRDISKIISFEALIIYVISLVGGLFCGIALSKLAELGLLNIISAKTDFGFDVPIEAVIHTIIVYSVIFAILFINSVRRVHSSDALSLLKSENVGEKPPRSNAFIAVLGLILLGGAYAISVSVRSPIKVLALFFVAVVMVIIATYMLMTAGSVTLCRALQKNKKYYYKKNHFVSVSSMAFRMKRNGAGLASICILSTMVLVMIVSSFSLFAGIEDSLHTIYPRNIALTVRGLKAEVLEKDNLDKFRRTVDRACAGYENATGNVLDYRYLSTYGALIGDSVYTDYSSINSAKSSDPEALNDVYVIPLEDYNIATGDRVSLENGQALIYINHDSYKYKSIVLSGARSLEIAGSADKLKNTGITTQEYAAGVNSIFLVVADFDEYIKPVIDRGFDESGEFSAPSLIWYYGFDFSCDSQTAEIIQKNIHSSLGNISDTEAPIYERFLVQDIGDRREDFYAVYGGLFFIGIILSLVFIIAAILIIYYKQVSEGYEDCARFEIMQKVGMTQKDIKKSINSQVLTVFFAPLIMAGIHLVFAFPALWKMLQLFQLFNKGLVVLVTASVFAVFAFFYVIVYKMTSNTYYKIVSNKTENQF